MDFAFSPEEQAFRQQVRAFLDEGLRERPAGGLDAWQFHRAFVQKLASQGWLTLAWPQEWGGQGAGYMMQLVYNEEMARYDAPANDIGSDRVGPTIMLYGTDEQKARYLPPIVKGEAVWCQGFSEPGAGSDLASLQTRAVEDGDTFVINGSKIWTSLAHFAESMILLARTDPDAPKHKGISCLLVDMTLPGITVRPLTTITGTHEFNEMFFDEVRVPAESMLGPVNEGWRVAMTTLSHERGGVAKLHLGTRRKVQRLFDVARETPMGDGRVAADDPVAMSRSSKERSLPSSRVTLLAFGSIFVARAPMWRSTFRRSK